MGSCASSQVDVVAPKKDGDERSRSGSKAEIEVEVTEHVDVEVNGGMVNNTFKKI